MRTSIRREETFTLQRYCSRLPLSQHISSTSVSKPSLPSMHLPRPNLQLRLDEGAA